MRNQYVSFVSCTVEGYNNLHTPVLSVGEQLYLKEAAASAPETGPGCPVRCCEIQPPQCVTP